MKAEASRKPAIVLEPRPPRRIVMGICAALVLACVAIYGQTLSFDFVDYNDHVYVTDNPHVRAGLHLESIGWAFVTDTALYFHPLTWMSHMLDCSLYGLQPWGHHLTNLLFHAMDAVLLFLVLRFLTRRLWPSAVVAALFAVHPLHVESVAWVAERKDVLCALFWMLSLGAYGLYVRRGGAGWYAAVVAAFVLGVMSKPMMVTLPCALLLMDCWPLNRFAGVKGGREAIRRGAWFVIEKVPLFTLALASALSTFIMQQRGGNLDFGHVVPFPLRLANAVVAYSVYLMKMVWPLGLAAFYPHPITRPYWQPVVASLVLLSITAGALATCRRRPYLIIGWLWYLGTLVPVIELVQAGRFAYADRYTYIPSIGAFIMVAWGVAELAAAWHIPRRAVTVVSGIALAGLTACAVVQTSSWRNCETLFQHAIAVGQPSVVAFNNLSKRALDQGRYDDAKTYLVKALALSPDDVFTLNALGMIAMRQRNHDEAKGYLTKAVALDPKYVNALNNLGRLALVQGRFDEAKMYLAKALDLEPAHVDALNNMGVVALEQDRYEEGEACLKKVVSLNPSHVGALNNLGRLAMNQGRFDEAKAYLTKVLNLDPRNAFVLNNLGLCLMNQSQYEESLQCFRKALEIDPQFVNVLNGMGSVLVKLGRKEEAKGYFERAAALSRAAASK